MITSRRHPVKFYFSYGFAIILCVATAALSIWATWEKDSTLKLVLAIVFSIGILIYLYHLIRFSIKNSPKITIDAESISFDEQQYLLKEIRKVHYTGKRKIKSFLFGQRREGALLHFRDGTTRVILDDTYSNTHKIKLFLQNALKKKAPKKSDPIKINQEDIGLVSYQEYKGYQLLCFKGSYIWLLVGPFIYVVLFKTISPVMPNLSLFVLTVLAWTPYISFDGVKIYSNTKGWHKWFKDEDLIQQNLDSTLNINGGGLYKCAVVDANGCLSDTASILLKGTASIIKTQKNNDIEVYPNPALKTITLKTNLTKNTSYRIWSTLGKLALTGPILQENTTIDISVLSADIYILEVNGMKIKLIKRY